VLLVLAFADAVADRIQATVGALHLHGVAGETACGAWRHRRKLQRRREAARLAPRLLPKGPSEPPERA